jgi:hypothetical protein
MTACRACGREQENGVYTHYLGCDNIAKPPPTDPLPELVEKAVAELEDGPVEPDPKDPEACQVEGCSNPKRPATKGPKPKFCEDHRDPKSRKE